MPSAIDESITSIFMEGFAIVRASLPNPLWARILTTSNEVFSGFNAKYSGSKKKIPPPDLAVQVQSSAGEI